MSAVISYFFFNIYVHSSEQVTLTSEFMKAQNKKKKVVAMSKLHSRLAIKDFIIDHRFALFLTYA